MNVNHERIPDEWRIEEENNDRIVFNDGNGNIVILEPYVIKTGNLEGEITYSITTKKDGRKTPILFSQMNEHDGFNVARSVMQTITEHRE